MIFNSRSSILNRRSRIFTPSIFTFAFCLCLASPLRAQDFDNSGTVDFSDFLLFVDAFGTSNTTFDLDTDGTVGFGDFLLFIEAFGSTSTDTPPNILLIIADDVGLDAMPGYDFGENKPNMPILEGLAAQGITYDNVWSAPLCSPTRATILTGRYGFRTGVLSVDNQISETETSIHTHIRENAGYADAIVGKWHLSGGRGNADDPNKLGVTYYAGYLSGSLQDYRDWPLTLDGSTSDTNLYATTAFTDLAIDWIGQQSAPWFMWLAHTAPHTPFHLPPDSLHARVNLTGTDDDIASRPRPYYFAAMEAMDAEIGRLLQTVDLESTIVIFIGDNGTPGQVSQSPVERMRAKGSIYEGGIRVPMIIAGQGVTRSGDRDSSLINTADLFATIADLAGTGTTNIHDSISFKPTFTAASSGTRAFAYSEIASDGIVDWAIRNDRFKLIGNDTGTRELYDLNADPYEAVELITRGLDGDATSAQTELEALVTQLKSE